MSDPNPPQEDDQAAKKHRWEDAVGQPQSSTTRWSSMTPRQYNSSSETPRMRATGGGMESSSWRGMATPTQYSSVDGTSLRTPRFGAGGATPMMNATPAMPTGQTPLAGGFGAGGGATPLMMGATPLMGATPMFAATPSAGMAFGATPNYQFEGTTPMQSNFAGGDASAAGGAQAGGAAAVAIEARAKQLEKEWRLKNKRLTAEYLDEVLPTDYFEVVPVPAEYNPLPPQAPNFYELALRSIHADAPAFGMPMAEDGQTALYDIPESLGDDMPLMKPQDAAIFVELLKYHQVDPIPDEHLPSYLLMRNLFKIKNGDAAQRRAGTRYLLDKARVLGSSMIVERIFHVWSADTLELQEKHYFIDFTKALVARMGTEIRTCAPIVVHMMEPLLTAQESIIREDGKQVLILLSRVVGLHCVFDAIKEDFAHEKDAVRRHTAKVAALVGYAVNVEEAMMMLRDLSYSALAFARQTVARTLGELATMCGHSILGQLRTMVPMLERLIRDEKRVRRDAATAIANIAQACAPFGIDELHPLVEVVCEKSKEGTGSFASAFLNAFGALVPLMYPDDAQERMTDMMPTLVSQFNTPEDAHRAILLNVVRRCIAAEGVSAKLIRETVMQPFFEGFWLVRRVAADRKTAMTLTAATVELAIKLGGSEVLQQLVPFMKDENVQYQRMVLDTVRRVVDAVGLAAVSDGLITSLLDGSISAVWQDETGVNRVVVDGLSTLCNALGYRLKLHMKSVFDLIKHRRENSEAMMRVQASELVARIAHAVMQADGIVFLQDLGRSLYERLEDPNGSVLASNLKATRAILTELGAARYKPSVAELLKKLTFVIKNKFSHVQHNAVLLIEDITTHYSDEVKAVHLHELATRGLFELLDAERRETRRACTRTFGVIANRIRPFSILLQLVDQLRQDKRKIRVCTAIAIAAIAKECGLFTVVPYLLNEYRISEGEQVAVIVQHAVLKSIRYVFEYVGVAGKDYILAFVPLMERALTETSLTMRRMAVEACRAMILTAAGSDGFADVTMHLLNLIHPNILELLSKRETTVAEERLKMVTAVVSFYEAARVQLGSATMLQYLQQGLFHPSTKVRDIYRRTYNMVYVHSPHQLVPYYPMVEDSEDRRFTRYALQVVV